MVGAGDLLVRDLVQADREAFGQAIALTQRYATLAVTTLVRVMSDDAAPHHARVSAATALLKLVRDELAQDQT